MPHAKSPPGLLGSVLREPTVHFLALAALLFVVDAVAARRGEANVIEVDPAELEARVMAIEATLGAPLSAADREQVREAYIDEQVLVREARALGLEDDARVDDFLAQKMLHVLSADVIQPTDAELEGFFQANRARYASPATVTIEELVVAVTGATPAPLLRRLRAGTPAGRLSAAVPLRTSVLTDTSLDDLTALFGAETAALVFRAGTGSWVGPHVTVRGQHWFRVTARTEAVMPPLATVREQVRLDWVADQEEVRLERRLDELRGRYRVVYTDEDERG